MPVPSTLRPKLPPPPGEAPAGLGRVVGEKQAIEADVDVAGGDQLHPVERCARGGDLVDAKVVTGDGHVFSGAAARDSDKDCREGEGSGARLMLRRLRL